MALALAVPVNDKRQTIAHAHLNAEFIFVPFDQTQRAIARHGDLREDMTPLHSRGQDADPSPNHAMFYLRRFM